MYSACSDGGSLRRVAPFRYPRITGYLLLTVAFRSLSRLSSALSAKASTLCSLSLDLSCWFARPAFGVASPTRRFLTFALSPMKLNSLFTLFLMSISARSAVTVISLASLADLRICSFQGAIYRNPMGYYLKVLTIVATASLRFKARSAGSYVN